MTEKINPREAALAGETSKGSEKISGLSTRLNRYSKAREHAIEFSEWLIDNGEGMLGAYLEFCGNWLEFRHYYTVDQVRLSRASFCKKHLLCNLCAMRRGAKQLKSYLDRYEVIQSQETALRASMVTLTVQNGENLGERFTHLYEGVRLLNKRRRNTKLRGDSRSEWSKVLGLVGTYETTNKGKGWHPHTHMIVLHREDIDQTALSGEWHGITGDSFVVDVRSLQHPDEPARDFVEVFKYALKFSDLSHRHHLKAFKYFSGRRLIFSAGLFRGVKVPKALTDEPLEDLPYIELFYRYITGSGYNFDRSKKVLQGPSR